MKEHPILFSTPMVQAILAGRKTQTRRIIKPQPIDNREVDGNFFEGNHKGYVKVDGHPDWLKQFVYEFCKYEVGDVLWVRETFVYREKHEKYYYKADHSEPYSEPYAHKGWRPSIFMPKEACRIRLKITDIRVERLQDISNEDARKEGVDGVEWSANDHGGPLNYKYEFEKIWQEINGKDSWDANPWVWVIEFKKA